MTTPALSLLSLSIAAPPPTTVTLTSVLAIGLSNASFRVADIADATGWPTVPVRFVAPLATSLAGKPGFEGTSTTAGASPLTEILSELTPGALPRVQMPIGVVGVALLAGALVTVPPPALTLIESATPAIGFPFWSFTTNAGSTGSGSPA